MQGFAYAGWNTDGNTLGTVISNAVILHLFTRVAPVNVTATAAGNVYFNSLRILEDKWYQANWRQSLSAYVDQLASTADVDGEATDNLAPDLPFYQRFIYKLLDGSYQQVSADFSLSCSLTQAYYPWNRTFEIGLVAAC